jgi:L-ascorbate metabolism protein UlaG (beta-lactamase superfamily)
MSPNHQSPRDAMKAFKELNARYFIPMHYGTFDLSDEPLTQPLKELHEAAGDDKGLKILTMGKPLALSAQHA